MNELPSQNRGKTFLDGRLKTEESRPSDLFIGYRFLENAQKINPKSRRGFFFLVLVLLESWCSATLGENTFGTCKTYFLHYLFSDIQDQKSIYIYTIGKFPYEKSTFNSWTLVVAKSLKGQYGHPIHLDMYGFSNQSQYVRLLRALWSCPSEINEMQEYYI